MTSTRNQRILAASALAVATIVAAWLALDAPQAGSITGRLGKRAGPESVSPAVADIRATPEPDPGAERTALGAEDLPALEPAVDEPPIGKYESKIVGRVVDAYEVPVAGAEISVILAVTGKTSPTIAATDAGGRFEVLLGWNSRSTLAEGLLGMTSGELRAVLDVAHARHFPVRRQTSVRGAGTTDLGTIRLEGVGRVHGTVRCAPGVDATTVAVVVCRDPAGAPLGSRTSTIPFGQAIASAPIASDGTFSFESVPAARVCVVASATGALFTASASIDLQAGEDRDIGDIVLEPNTSVVAGIVRMPDGAPCRRANIRYGSASGTVFFDENVDAEGRFRIEDVEHEVLRLVVYRSGDATFCETTFDGVRAGSVDLVLDVVACEMLRVRVFDTADRPITKFRADKWLDGDAVPRGGTPIDWPDGTTSIASSGRPFRIYVASPGYESASVGPFSGGGGDVRVVLHRARSIMGRVVADGAGAARVPVFLHAVAESGATWSDGLPARTELVARAQSVTDGEGRFTFESPESGAFVVIARAPDWAACESKPLDLRGDATPAPLELALDRGGAIEARVTSKSGRDVGGTVLGASCGDGHLRTATVASDGTVRIDRLSAGTWWIGPVRAGLVTQYHERIRFLGPVSECIVARDRVRIVAIELD